ncbi:MAG: histidine phosphotransferase [Mesorhizobium sp.]|uniref:Hpt domain-containing protein n=1 Tax=Mesorhizobium sp. TaxID=1871066 RepID=UPI000FE8E868|nr:MAG: histidine phosphotransferase [Mesorhizobium sp.]RWF40779.1 MAG: histidine phosphotransferase [Mesorhizobium sp.]TJW06338.1 MAG: histidine phosphotransferase [Mesorhizobium sp.]
MLEYPLTQPRSTPIATDPFAPLRQRFLARCADQLAELKAAREAPLPGNDPLIRLAHSLAGAAGTFGFPEISAKASALEMLLTEQADGGAVGAALDALIAEVERTLQ